MSLSGFADNLLHIVLESAPFLLLGFLLAGVFRALISDDRIHRLLGEDRFRSVFRASLLGVPLPLCSCSVIPAATALRQSGASRGATTSFLISTPETGVDSIGITYALMDPIMTITRPVAAFCTALLTGAAVGRFAPPEAARPETAPPAPDARTMAGANGCCTAEPEPCCGTSEPPPGTLMGEIIAGIRYAFGPLLDDLAPWLIVGGVLAAAIAATLPAGALSEIPQGWISSALMMVIATPMYICASAATPVAAALIAKGLDPGAALVLLLVGPATNVATMLIVSRLMGRRVLIVYLAGVAAAALAFGFLINGVYSMLDIDLATTIAVGTEPSPSAVGLAAAVVLVALLLRSLLARFSAGAAAGPEGRTPSVLR